MVPHQTDQTVCFLGGSVALAVDLVRRGAARFPDRTAVLFEDRSLTYREVDEAANRFAQVLIGQGV